MATWEDLQAVNAEIKTTQIKGKEYAEVPQRIQAFRKLYPEGYITSEIKHWSDEVVVMIAECGFYEADGNKHTLGTGTAFERQASSFINKTSFVENCETSAVGRALGMAGFGVDGSVASALEVANAIENQKAVSSRDDLEKPMTQEQREKIIAEAKRTGNVIETFEQAKHKEFKDFTRLDADSIIRQLARRRTKE